MGHWRYCNIYIPCVFRWHKLQLVELAFNRANGFHFGNYVANLLAYFAPVVRMKIAIFLIAACALSTAWSGEYPRSKKVLRAFVNQQACPATGQHRLPCPVSRGFP
jgi:hypothetical protein